VRLLSGRSPVRSRVLIVDSYNVLHAAPRVDPGFAGLTLSGLASLLAASRFQGSGVILVCDGTGTRTGVDESLTHPDAPVRVVFAGPGKDADAAIERLVIEEERKGRSGSLTVVSSDKGVLASAIGPFGPKPKRMTSEQLLRMLVQDAARAERSPGNAPVPDRGSLDSDAVRRWVKQFGFEPVERPSAPAPRPADPARANEPAPNAAAGPAPKQDWPDGIDPDDLDMRKWLKE
jgi:predicted RNA-binding protein with PIN domain